MVKLNLEVFMLMRFIYTALFFYFLAGCATTDNADIDNAIKNNQLKKLEQYSASPYVNSTTVEKNSMAHANALSSAIFQGNLSAVKKLVAIGANHEAVIKYRTDSSLSHASVFEVMSVSSAEYACTQGQLEISDYLLQKFPREKFDYSRCLFLYFAPRAESFVNYPGLTDGALVDEFYYANPHLNRFMPADGESFLYELVSRGADINVLTEAKLQRALKIPADASLEYVTDKAITNKNYNDYIFRRIHIKSASALVSLGIDTDYVDLWLAEPMSLSGRGGNPQHQKLVQAFIDRGKSPDFTMKSWFKIIDASGRTRMEEIEDFSLLHSAAYYGASEYYAYLLAAGANPNVVDSRGAKPMDYAGMGDRVVQIDSYNAKAIQQPTNNNIFSKALAIGLGSAAIGSLGVSNDIAIEAVGSLAADIANDTGGTNINNMRQLASNNIGVESLNKFQEPANNHMGTVDSKDTTSSASCTAEKTAKYPGTSLYDLRKRCFPIAALCWGWGVGADSVYEYCSEDALMKRGQATFPADKDTAKDWDCGGSKSRC